MFDSTRFLRENFQSPDGVIGLLGSYGLSSPPRDTVRKWFARGGIPSMWLPLLVVILELDRGQPVPLAPYLISGEGHGH